MRWDGDAQAGVVKMNVDTDTQWAYWEGVKKFYQVGEARTSRRRGRDSRRVSNVDSPLSMNLIICIERDCELWPPRCQAIV